MSIPGMEDHRPGVYFCNVCGIRLTYGKICLDCRRAKKGKPSYSRDQRNNAEVYEALKGLGLIFVVFPLAALVLFALAIALEG